MLVASLPSKHIGGIADDTLSSRPSRGFYIRTQTKNGVSFVVKGSRMCTVVILWDERAHVFVVFCVLKNALLCVPCWSRWWLRPRCHMAAPGCVRHRGRAQRWSTCWCRTSPAPRSPSPPCTPSSGCQWAPGGNSVEKKYSRFVTIAFHFFRSIKLTTKSLTFFLHLSACLCFCTSLWLWVYTQWVFFWNAKLLKSCETHVFIQQKLNDLKAFFAASARLEIMIRQK